MRVAIPRSHSPPSPPPQSLSAALAAPAMHRGAVLAQALAAMLCVALADEMYSTKYDNVDLKEILRSPRLYQSYLRCLLGDGDEGCPPQGKELRKMLPEALKSRCSKCNDKQKETVKYVINELRTDHPEDWDKLKAKWDPSGEYLPKYLDLLPLWTL